MKKHQKINFDTFLKSFMTDLFIAKDLLLCHLPEEILSLIDLSGLSSLPQESISLGLQIKTGDLIYKVPPKNKGAPPFIIYIEAQTNFHKKFLLRLRAFEANLQWEWFKTHNEIAVVIPVIISTSGKFCTRKPDYLNLFPETHKEIISKFTNGSSVFLDFCALDDFQIERHPGFVPVVETMVKKVRTTSFRPLLNHCIKYFKRAIEFDKYDPVDTSDHFHAVICLSVKYCKNVPEGKELKDYLISLEQQLPNEIGEKVMNLYEQLEKIGRDEGMLIGKQKWLDEGMLIGKQEGMLMGKQEIVQNMLKNGMSVEQVMAYTGVSRETLLNAKKSK